MRPWIALVLAAAACRSSTDTPPIDALAGSRLRIATFNVRRFFDTICDSGACGPDDYEAVASPPYFDERATQIADAILALDADLVSLQELETQACLDALLARLGGMHGVLGEIDFAASVDVAIVSKAPIEQTIRHRATSPLLLPDGTATTFSRELLEVHVTVHGHPVVLFSAHFKAKSDDDPPRRLAEARVSTQLVNALATREPSTIVLLAGDLNDTPGSPPLDALTVDGGLLRLADDLAVPAQATYYYQGQGQAIDHVLLAPTTSALRLPRSTRAWRDGTGWGGSDHAALTSDLVMPD